MHRSYHHKLDQTITVLEPGEYYATDKQEILYTLVGSCIAACVYDLDRRIAGMNHFMLPGIVDPRNILRSEVGRYGMFAMELLIGELVKLGAERKRFKAKIFGGGNTLGSGHSVANVAQANIDFARKFLELEGIPIAAEDMGGHGGRKILFFADTGKVLMQRVASPTAIAPLTRAEEQYRRTILRNVSR